jgi:hypothetical protein
MSSIGSYGMQNGIALGTLVHFGADRLQLRVSCGKAAMKTISKPVGGSIVKHHHLS